MNANDLLTDPSAGTFCAEVAEYVKGKRFHVPAGALTVSRVPQVDKLEAAEKLRARLKARKLGT